MTYEVSDCCGARIFYDEEDRPICIQCQEECEPIEIRDPQGE